MLSERARTAGLPLVYLNLLGGQDELVFDGQSMVFTADGELLYRAPQFEEDLFWVDLPLAEEGQSGVKAVTVSRGDLLEGDPEPPPESHPRLPEDEEIYRALCLGLRDYVHKNGFERRPGGAVRGHRLGADRGDRRRCAGSRARAGRHDAEPVLVGGFGGGLPGAGREPGHPVRRDPHRATVRRVPRGAGRCLRRAPKPDVTEENLQARVRGTILMALSNKFGGLVLATGNKSELSVGYATLYGDMVGGYAVLKDLFKHTVYRLAEWRNRDGEVIPQGDHRQAAVGRAAPRPEGHRLAAAVLRSWIRSWRPTSRTTGPRPPSSPTGSTGRRWNGWSRWWIAASTSGARPHPGSGSPTRRWAGIGGFRSPIASAAPDARR